MKQKLKHILNPRVIILTLLSAAFLAFLLAFANSGEVFSEILQAISTPQVLAAAIVLTLFYLITKLMQWKLYLAHLDLRPSWSDLLLPYAGGEIGNSLPMGVYLENYLMKGTQQADIGRTAAATTWMLITEIIVCLCALIAIGIPHWAWTRPTAAGMLVGMTALGLILLRTRLVSERLDWWKPRAKWLRRLQEGLSHFIEGSSTLFSWRTLVYGLPLTALYLGAHATILYAVGQILIGSSAQPWSWAEAASAFAFSMLIVLLVPVLPHLGSVEISGVGVLLQYGVNRSSAVASFLAVRLLTTGTIILVCLVVLLVLHRKLGKVFRRLSRQREEAKPGPNHPQEEGSQEPEPQEQEA